MNSGTYSEFHFKWPPKWWWCIHHDLYDATTINQFIQGKFQIHQIHYKTNQNCELMELQDAGIQVHPGYQCHAHPASWSNPHSVSPGISCCWQVCVASLQITSNCLLAAYTLLAWPPSFAKSPVVQAHSHPSRYMWGVLQPMNWMSGERLLQHGCDWCKMVRAIQS